MDNPNAITTIRNLDLIRQAVENDPRLPSHHTKRQYLATIENFMQFAGDQVISKSLVESYASQLQEAGRSPNTINQKLAVIRWLARKISDLAIEQLSDMEADIITRQTSRVATVRGVTGDRQPRGRHISTGELSALMTACDTDSSPAGRRDACLFAIAWSCGLRRDELARLTLEDVKPVTEDEADLMVKHGKGNKQRQAYLFNGSFQAWKDWLAVRGELDTPYLFVNVNKGGRIIKKAKTDKAGRVSGERLSGDALRKVLVKRAKEAGISEAIGWHDFRRTFAGNLLDSSIDLATVQKLMGHKSSDTTTSYDRRPEATRRQAVKVLFVPYRKR